MTTSATIKGDKGMTQEMYKQRLRSWRVFTIIVGVLAVFAGYVLGMATTNLSHSESWRQGYDAALSTLVEVSVDER